MATLRGFITECQNTQPADEEHYMKIAPAALTVAKLLNLLASLAVSLPQTETVLLSLQHRTNRAHNYTDSCASKTSCSRNGCAPCKPTSRR